MRLILNDKIISENATIDNVYNVLDKLMYNYNVIVLENEITGKIMKNMPGRQDQKLFESGVNVQNIQVLLKLEYIMIKGLYILGRIVKLILKKNQ